MKKNLLLSLLALPVLFLWGCSHNKNNDVLVYTWDTEKITELEEQLSWLIEQFSLLQAENNKIKEALSWAIEIAKTLTTENETLQSNVDKYKKIIIDNKLSTRTWTTSSTTNTTLQSTNTKSTTISKNKISLHQWYEVTDKICKWHTSEWLPNAVWAADAKFINTILQDIRDNWQHLTKKYINEANQVLDWAGVTNKDICRYSRLIDVIQNQQWYIKSYTTKNWVTTIWIDFITYQTDISKIKYDGSPRLDIMKNTSTKVRYYILSSTPQLQTLYRDSNGYVTNMEKKIYLNNFNSRLNEFCNNQYIYIQWSDINWNENNFYCVKNILKTDAYPNKALNFNFNSGGELQKIDLNRRRLALAG